MTTEPHPVASDWTLYLAGRAAAQRGEPDDPARPPAWRWGWRDAEQAKKGTDK